MLTYRREKNICRSFCRSVFDHLRSVIREVLVLDNSFHWDDVTQQVAWVDTSSVLSDDSVLTQWSVSTQRSVLSVGDFPPVRDVTSPNRWGYC